MTVFAPPAAGSGHPASKLFARATLSIWRSALLIVIV
jgi:hypothetical protein